MSFNNVIGIAGGMGPQAGILLCRYITAFTPAGTDQEHLPMILMSFPGQIADRTDFLEGRVRANPAYAIANVIGRLERAGATVIGIACNTSHSAKIFDVVVEELQRMGSRARLLHMPDETCSSLGKDHPEIRRVGLMLTNGSYAAGVYESLLRARGYEVVLPDPVFQEEVIHRMVYDREAGIKAHPDRLTAQARRWGREAMRYFGRERAQAVILGCTEFSLLDELEATEGIAVVDSSKAMARALIREALSYEDQGIYHPAANQR